MQSNFSYIQCAVGCTAWELVPWSVDRDAGMLACSLPLHDSTHECSMNHRCNSTSHTHSIPAASKRLISKDPLQETKHFGSMIAHTGIWLQRIYSIHVYSMYGKNPIYIPNHWMFLFLLSSKNMINFHTAN